MSFGNSDRLESLVYVYCLYDDGNHIECFPTYEKAEAYALDGSNHLSRYWEIEKELFDAECDCGNQRITLPYNI